MSTSLLFYSLFLHFIYLLLQFLVNLLYTLGIIYVFLHNSYYRSSGHVVLECRITFGDIHFLCKLILFMHFYRHFYFNLRYSFILSTKFFVSPRILTVLTVHCFSCSYLFGIFAHRVTWCQNVGLPLEIIISAVN